MEVRLFRWASSGTSQEVDFIGTFEGPVHDSWLSEARLKVALGFLHCGTTQHLVLAMPQAPSWYLKAATGGRVYDHPQGALYHSISHTLSSSQNPKSLLVYPSKEVSLGEPGRASGHLPATPAARLLGEKGLDVTQSRLFSSLLTMLRAMGH